MKKQKGLTLIEIIVALFLYALLALLLVEIMTLVNTTMTSTNQLNERLSFEGQLADNQLVGRATSEGTPGLRIQYGEADANGNWTALAGTIAERNGAPLTYNAWVARYDNPDLQGVVDYAELVNYRFMTFTNETRAAQSLQDYAFHVHIMIVPFLPNRDGIDISTAEGLANARSLQNKAFDFIDDITSIEVNGKIIDTTQDNSVENGAHLIANSSLPFVVNAHPDRGLVTMLNNDNTLNVATPYTSFAILNLADPETVAGRNQVSNDTTETPDGYDVTVTFKAGTEDRLTITLPAAYMYVKRGDTESYYEQTMVVLDLSKFDSRDATVRSEAIVACRSKASTDSYTSADYDVLPS